VTIFRVLFEFSAVHFKAPHRIFATDLQLSFLYKPATFLFILNFVHPATTIRRFYPCSVVISK